MNTNYTISEMAKIHNISRQTLIYYDKIGLFQPEHLNEQGYRFYTLEQCPLLREIRLLTTLNVPLNEIKDYLNNKDLNRAAELLSEQLRVTEKRIKELNRIKRITKLRLNNFRKVSKEKYFGLITFNEQPKRYYTFMPYKEWPDTSDQALLFREMILQFKSHEKGHNFYTYYNELEIKHGQLLLKKTALVSENIFKDCGAVIYSSEEILPKIIKDKKIIESLNSFPAGLYASTLYNGRIETSESAVRQFLKSIEVNNMEIAGDIIFTSILEQPFTLESSAQTYEIQVLCKQ